MCFETIFIFLKKKKILQAISLVYSYNPQPYVVHAVLIIFINILFVHLAWTAICVQNVDVHVSCSSHDDAQLAAFFIDP